MPRRPLSPLLAAALPTVLLAAGEVLGAAARAQALTPAQQQQQIKLSFTINGTSPVAATQSATLQPPSAQPAATTATGILSPSLDPTVEVNPTATFRSGAFDALTGPRSRLGRDWVGTRVLPPSTPILVMAGHADSQNMAGSGTSGAAVAWRGARPMQPGISDELYWNLAVAERVIALGRARGLNISGHQPPSRTILNGDAPGTNWSMGRAHVAAGGYALEIHFDAYGPDGIGSGLIPPVNRPNSLLDESLAQEFGGYPLHFRNVLGGPRRGIALLEIGKLEGTLEASLRDPSRREATLNRISERVVSALEAGLARRGSAVETLATTPQAVTTAEATVAQPPAATTPAARPATSGAIPYGSPRTAR